MSNVAVICEFNPFHNGHAAILARARELAGPIGNVTCVMSGNFVQRGDIAVAPKWVRTEAALKCGADIVVEIPSIFAMNSAQFFAEAGVSIANFLENIDFLLFGSETGDIDFLTKIAENSDIREHLAGSDSYAKALESACGEKLLSNDILGVEYIRALKKSGSQIVPVTFKRVGSSAETDSSSGACSALAIRNMLKEGNIAGVSSLMPEAAFSVFNSYVKASGLPDLFRLESYIIGKLRELGPFGIANIPGISEGLENKIYKEASSGSNLNEIIENCTNKRYTRSRIRRILLSVVTGAQSEYLKTGTDSKCTNFCINVPYIRVLGICDESKSLLSQFNSLKIPVIVGNIPVDFENRSNLSDFAKKIIRSEILATDLYSLCFEKPDARKSGKELSSPLVIVRKA